MRMSNLSAQELLSHFAVRGHFYEREDGGAVWPMRDRLEIFDKALAWEGVRDGSADLVAVMMNPGGSRPIDEGGLFDDGSGWHDALPDRTQYQLMKLALGTEHIRHIRVINLSDLRTPKSAELFATLPKLGGWHSIFDASRDVELQRALGVQGTPVLLAWGMALQLRPLAKQALARIHGHQTFGISEDGIAYRHPLPQRYDLQQQWLQVVGVQMATLRSMLS